MGKWSRMFLMVFLRANWFHSYDLKKLSFLICHYPSFSLIYEPKLTFGEVYMSLAPGSGPVMWVKLITSLHSHYWCLYQSFVPANVNQLVFNLFCLIRLHAILGLWITTPPALCQFWELHGGSGNRNVFNLFCLIRLRAILGLWLTMPPALCQFWELSKGSGNRELRSVQHHRFQNITCRAGQAAPEVYLPAVTSTCPATLLNKGGLHCEDSA